jgi:HlyD family secretion protein
MATEGNLDMKKRALLILLIVLTSALAVTWFVSRRTETAQTELVLYGNVDLRQVDLAFNGSQRIAAVMVEEGSRVDAGQVLGLLEKDRLEATVTQAKAQVQVQRHVVERLENGSRPEEIRQARANVESARADLKNSRIRHDRLRRAIEAGATSRQELDEAETAVEVAEARLKVNQEALDLALAGPRKEDIAEAHARLGAAEAELALLGRELKDATLLAPSDGIVQNRILEPGEMATPQRPVLTIALTDPKWVRAYVTEPDLGKIRHGMEAIVMNDSFPGKKYAGWVGFISPSAEFTPKSVETTELRTALVYEVRVFIKDPTNDFRLGMPATVHIPLDQTPASPEGGAGVKTEANRNGG